MTESRRPSDDLLIQLIRENRHDAEIGVRMGITTGEVRGRKAELRRRLGEDRYQRAIAGRPERSTPFWRRRWFGWSASVFAFGAALLALANVIVDDPEAAAPPRTVGPATATPLPPLREAAIVTAEGQRFDDAGKFFALSTDNGLDFVGSPTNRATFASMELAGTGYVVPSEFAHWEYGGTGYREIVLHAKVSGREVTVRVNSAHAATRVRPVSEAIGPVARVVSQLDVFAPRVSVRGYNSEGQQLMVRLTANGHLHISHDPVPQDWVVASNNGSRVETGESIVVGEVTRGPRTSVETTCSVKDEAFRCRVLVQPSVGVLMARPGTVSCPDRATRRYEADGIVVHFSKGFSFTTGADDDCEPHLLEAAAHIVSTGSWEVSAERADGTPLSIGATLAGTLVVGQFSGNLSCPCSGQ